MGLESLSPVGLGIDAASQLFRLIYGAGQMISGGKGLKDLQRPELTQDPFLKQNQLAAGQKSSSGYGDQFLNFGGDAIERNLGTSINAGLKTGEGLGFINNAAGTANNAFQQMLMADAMQKSRNQDALTEANKGLSEDRLRMFNWNSAIPYEQDFNKFTNQTNSGVQNLFGGAQGFGSSAIGFGDYFSGSGGGNGFGSGNKTGIDMGTSQPGMGNDSGTVDPKLLQQLIQLLQQQQNKAY